MKMVRKALPAHSTVFRSHSSRLLPSLQPIFELSQRDGPMAQRVLLLLIHLCKGLTIELKYWIPALARQRQLCQSENNNLTYQKPLAHVQALSCPASTTSDYFPSLPNE